MNDLHRALRRGCAERPRRATRSGDRLKEARMDELQKAILDYVKKEYLDADSDTAVEVDTPLISSGIVDSFSMVSLKTFLEKKYKIQIPDAQATPEAFDSVQKIAVLVTTIQKG
jgi:acyl carrier protein/D-alanine--poly(phosphoribitol) ligase subunit 2